MSKRAEEFLRKYKIHAATSRNVTFPSSDGKVYNLHELMETFLDDSLSEVMHELKFSKRMEASKEYIDTEKLSDADAIIFHHGILHAFRIIRDKFWKQKNYDV